MFYFAWQDDGLSDFGPDQYRVDEDIFSFKLVHSEGDFARLDIEIVNPRVGLLSAGRKQWAWFAWRKPDLSVVPLFHGRLVGVPENLEDETIGLTLLARPVDYDAQRESLAQSLRVLPYFDPVFIDASHLRDPDAVLEGRSALWHIGRADKLVTVSDIIDGEDGIIEFGEAAAPVFKLDISYSGEPLRSVNVNAEVSWKQAAAGTVDITPKLLAAFAAAGSSGPMTSFTGQGLEADWPLPGEVIGGGWIFETTTLTLLSDNGSLEREFVDTPIDPASIQQPPNNEEPNPAEDTVNPFDRVRFYLWVFSGELRVSYEASRDRSEIIDFALHADVQDLLTQSDEPRTVDLSFRSNTVGEPVDDADSADSIFTGEALPLGTLARRSYFSTERGKRSLQFLICVARARLLLAARAAHVNAEITFEAAVMLSCRMSARLSDARLPGGEVLGKVIGYQLGLDGERGELSGGVTIACTIGRGGGAPAAAAGTPLYVEVGYFDNDAAAQEMAGGETVAVAGQIGGVKYTDFLMPSVDDGVDFDQMTADANVLSLVVVNGETVQRAALAVTQGDTQNAVNALNEVHTRVRLNLRPVTGGPFQASRVVEVSDLVIPRNLNLEAA